MKMKTSSQESKQELRFVDINNINGSKLAIDGNDLKSFEKSKITTDSKKKKKTKLSYNNVNTNYYNNKANTVQINKVNKLYISTKSKIAKKEKIKIKILI